MEDWTLAKDMVLGGLLYHESIRSRYLIKMKGNYSTLLDPADTTPYTMIERTISLFIRTDITTNSDVMFRQLIEDSRKIPPANKQYKDGFMQLVMRLGQKELYTEQLCSKYLDEFVSHMSRANLKELLNSKRSEKEILEALEEYQDRVDSDNAENQGTMEFFDPIESAQRLLKHRTKVPTGISFFDALTGGGITFGEHGGCLGPSGGGKSIIANMLVCNVAIQGHKTMLMQFEQSITNNSDIISRIYSYLTGMPTTEFRNKDFAELSEDTVKALEKCKKISSRIRIASFQDSNVHRSVEAIIEKIEEFKEKSNFVPELVVVDWLGALVEDFLTSKEETYPIAAYKAQDRLCKYGTDHGITFFFLHQLSNDAANRESGYKPSKYDSYQFRGFAQRLEFCLQIGTGEAVEGDSRFAAWLVCGKVRDAEPQKSVVVMIDGKYAKMDVAEPGQFIVNKRNRLVPAQSLTRALGDTDDVFAPTGADAFMNSYR